MSGSDDKGVTKVEHELPLKELAKTRGQLPERYDLDRNPIKFRQYDGSMSTEAHDKDYMELTLRSGKHSDLVQKLLRQKIEARAQEFPRWPADYAGGVRVMWLESRYWYDRERLSPHFDDDWRKYRSRYLHSLELDPSEPLWNVSAYEKLLINPIRRLYQKPGDWLEKHVIQRFTNDRHKSNYYRIIFTRPWLVFAAAVLWAYRVRYCEETWEVPHGQILMYGKPQVYPGDKLWPWVETKTSHWHFNDKGFLSRSVYKDLRNFEDSQMDFAPCGMND